MSSIYIYGRVIKTRNPLIPVQGHWWPQPIPAPQGARRNTPWTGCPSIAGPLTPTLNETGTNLDTLTHLTWEKTADWRKPTQTWGGRANSTPTVALTENQFLFSHQCYNKTTLNKMTLSEDLLYQASVNNIRQ